MKEFLGKLAENGELERVSRQVSTDREISYLLQQNQERAFLFETVGGSALKVAGNLYGTRRNLELGLGMAEEEDLVERIQKAIANPAQSKGHVSSYERSEWDYSEPVDLTKLPILKHFDKEAGKYITAGIVAAKFPGTDSENLSFHRMLVISKTKLAARVVPRHLNQIGKDLGGSGRRKIPVSIIIGPPPAVFLSASLQTHYGLSEYKIANRLMNEKLELSLSQETDIAVPADSEIILEGELDFSDLAKEGPFVDLTGTYDEVRDQPTITLTRMSYRRDSVYQVVLASSREHAMFMGLPQELKIREALALTIPKVRGVNLTPSSGGYFHCIVSIEKTNDGDGRNAIMACLGASHPLKLVIAVDSDVDPFNLSQVEWALATRFQADKGTVVISGARGSSLDPSSAKSAVTSKLGLDATLPLKADRSLFEVARITPPPEEGSTISSQKLKK